MSESASHRAVDHDALGFKRIVRTVSVTPIVIYQHVISPAIPQRCKYEPTCSRYAVEAIGQYGILRGLVLAGWRLLRCNPWSHGGYDPVESQRVFRIESPTQGPDHGG
jgi:uncharacterized protein